MALKENLVVLKGHLIDLGYVTADTPDSTIERIYRHYIAIEQAGIKPVPYAIGLISTQT